MYQNIKVDIIYYKTATDFEMEFNLSGCCRMRLLTDKAPDRKILISHLVRAVSRSRIIMISGALFGEEGIIATCSKAIGQPLEQIDNAQYGISAEDEIKVIKGSIPLVGSNGIFGGCIIEQGPQTLILLSENKGVRKDIMQNLIHSYIKEICAQELTEKAAEPNPVITEADHSENDISQAEEPAAENSAEECELDSQEPETETEEDEPQNEAEAPSDEAAKEDMPDADADYECDYLRDTKPDDLKPLDGNNDIDRRLYSEILFSPNDKKHNSIGVNFEDDVLFNKSDDEATAIKQNFDEDFYVPDLNSDDADYPRRRTTLNIPIIILSVILLLVVLVLCYCIFFSPEVNDASIGSYLSETFGTLFG